MQEKLIAELREWWDKRPGTGLGYSAMLEWGTEFQKILSRHEAEQGEGCNADCYEMCPPDDMECCNTSPAPTYAQAEAKARAYLEGLPTKAKEAGK